MTVVDNAKIAGVVVTYHPPATVEGNLRAMVRECGRVLIVDNGSDAETRRIMAAVPGVVLMAPGENLGVASALNRGAEWARAGGCEWIVTFDQDSMPRAGMIAALWAGHLELPSAKVIGPAIEEPGFASSSYRWIRRHPRFGWLFQRVCRDARVDAVTMVITSGSLIELSLWVEVGGFDEALFIDYVDVDYCLRVIRAGYRVAVAPLAVLDHHLGNRLARSRFGHDFRPMNHAAFRHYYMARNRVRIWRRHALAMPHWALFDFCFAGYNMLRVLAFETDKWDKWKASLLGTWAGLLGRSGPCPESLRKKFGTSRAIRE